MTKFPAAMKTTGDSDQQPIDVGRIAVALTFLFTIGVLTHLMDCTSDVGGLCA